MYLHFSDRQHARGHRLTLRGLYYLSPFLRDFQNCRQIRDLFREVAGEELIPHPSYSSVPQVDQSTTTAAAAAATAAAAAAAINNRN